VSETLSQDEINALIKGMASGEVVVEDPIDAPDVARPYNLVGEERSVGRQFPGLDLVHERFVRKLRQSFSNLVASSASVEMAGLEMLRFGTFRNRLSLGSPISLFSMSPLRGSAMIMMSPSLAFQLVDRIFGGPGHAPELATVREYSAIELQVLQRVVCRILGDLAEAWAPVQQLDCSFGRTETNPSLVALTATEDMVLSLELQCDLGAGATKLLTAMPFAMLEPLRSKLGEPQAGPGGADRAWLRAMEQAVRAADVNLSVELGRCELRAKDVLDLKVGDTLCLETREGDVLDVLVEGRHLLAGVAGVSRGQNAVRVSALAADAR
jgi:flagellar motor switch protein FliM